MTVATVIIDMQLDFLWHDRLRRKAFPRFEAPAGRRRQLQFRYRPNEPMVSVRLCSIGRASSERGRASQGPAAPILFARMISAIAIMMIVKITDGDRTLQRLSRFEDS
jgi:hypothetical protein